MRKIFWCATMLVIGSASYAQTTVEISPEKDNSIYSESENSNGEGELHAGQTCDDDSRRALIEFDVAGTVPFGATITGVTLTLNLSDVSPGAGTQDYSLHRVGTEWGEGASSGGEGGAEAVAPDATWLDAMFESSVWNEAGGDFYEVASATTPVGEGLIDYSWSSAGMVTNVQNWLDYPGSNHGWILIGDEETTCNNRTFGSKDEGTAPVLEITYTCTDGPAVARCHALTVYLDDAGAATISAEDVDNGSGVPCDGELTLSISESEFTCDDIMDVEVVPSMIITGVFDCPLPGGLPKGVEVYVINDIADLSTYGIGFAQNGGGTDGEEFTFPVASASAGSYMYIVTEGLGFAQWFGFDPSYTTGHAAINGDDAIELFYEGEVIDTYGDVDVDGTGETWDYVDGWAYRISNTDLDGGVYDPSHWVYSGANELDGEATNATAEMPVPIGTYFTDPTVGLFIDFVAAGDIGDADSCLVSIIVLDTLPPVMSCVGALTYVLDETGMVSIDATDIDAGTEDGCGIDEISISMDTFTCENEGENEVWLYATDVYGNADSCMVVITIDASEVLTISEGELSDPTCYEFEDGSITILVEGGAPDYTYDWDNDGTGDADDAPIVNTIGAGVYEVIVVDENGCQATASFELTEAEEIVITGEVTNESCAGAADGSIDLTITGGTEPYAIVGEVDELEAGDYLISVTDDNGCSAILDFTIESGLEIDLTVTVTGTDLMSNQDGAIYQWVECPDFTVIDGATDQTYSSDGPGAYAVIITVEGGCSDTTDCFEVGFDNIYENTPLSLAVYPNPTNGVLNLKLGNMNNQALITVMDLKGSVIFQKNTAKHADQIDLSGVENGIYFIQVAADNAVITKKITVSK